MAEEAGSIGMLFFSVEMVRCDRYNKARNSVVVCSSGGIGRHVAFRALCPQGRGGSNPLSSTIKKL